MSRRPLIAGNWKLHKTVPEALELSRGIKDRVARFRGVEVVVAPPYTALWPVSERLKDSALAVAAQELFYEDQGAFTGCVSAPMLKDVGCRFVLVGHSERRQHFGETLESSTKRVAAAVKAGLVPILCVGETLAEREADRTLEVVNAQLDAGLAGAGDALATVVVAYEPVWAIGTGKVATPAQAQEVHAQIRERVRAMNSPIADGMRLLYGGSVKPGNAKDLLAQQDIDGALVGGASLKVDDFVAIVEAAA